MTVDVVVGSSVVVTTADVDVDVDVDGSNPAASVVVVDAERPITVAEVSSVDGSGAASEAPQAETTRAAAAIACVSLVIAIPVALDLRSAWSVSGSLFSSTQRRANRVELLIGRCEDECGIGCGDERYLAMLNREVSARVRKPVPPAQLDVLANEELSPLNEA